MIGRLIVRGFALVGAVVVIWTSFAWAKLSRERWREANEGWPGPNR